MIVAFAITVSKQENAMRFSRLGDCLIFVLLLAASLAARAAYSAPFAYIPNSSSATVSVIDTATNSVVATVPVGTNPQGVAVHPAGTHIYVGNVNSNTVSVIDTAANIVVATIPVGSAPQGIALHPAGTFVYVTNAGSNSVSVINAANNAVVGAVTVGQAPIGIAVNSAGTRAYVANVNGVSVINLATRAVVATVPLVGNLGAIAINPAGTLVYVANASRNDVSVIDTATNSVIATTVRLLGGAVKGVAVNPAGTFAYVAHGNSLSVIDVTSNAVAATVAVGSGAFGVAVHPLGTFVYVANSTSHDVSVVDTGTNTVVATVPVGLGPSAIGQFIGGVPQSDPARLSNLSTRGQVLTGNDVMIGGFVIGGAANKTVVVRARGPSLTPFGITNALANPHLQLVRSSDQTTLVINDNWGSAPNAAALTASGFAPSDSLEAAILINLPPGAYTAIVSDVSGGTGVAIVEIFEQDGVEVPLTNISTRGQVLTGNDVMIGGFVIGGAANKTVVVRARGPSLTPFGITNALANPHLQLVRSSDQTTLVINDNWGSAPNAAALTASGFAPSDSLEAAILIDLPPGAYTAIVSGVGGGTGVGIIEVFAQ